ncbi:MAG: glycoside hydrolase family 15 [Candidatus Omnitrophica bacterium CG11_big_fil_rev_8_21_14_0_20_45_26]|uniref:Glycoside hydrolase family 15 n=1 Tax=Candidatus Abzuiibacterium crystallinum TaxID=1974748 RepID=A0A2H0LPN9_9BACT|nr:MAG: glycoside hydrolase family 15 [Candidatus Omnitrophica bacterium CG11_big_fil_rev_8_21_14_0_20_45_26]PIW63598.1 MAG: glycoside hydrolase family 15 [Candidatus Omnitrophica bacterium CG12_big_fil_rev_8_21_14_0_65_45_16]
MPKDIPVSNGSFLLNFDSDYQIRDIYFPFIGQENHSSGHPFSFGVWVDGQHSWMGAEWEKDLRYQDDSLVTNVLLKHQALKLELRCSDVVDLDLNVYVKKIEVTNLEDKVRQVRLFFSHDFNLYGNDIGGTAYFDPRSCSIIHYKMHRYFLMSCWAHEAWGVKHFSCGRRDASGSLAIVKQIERGELSGEASAWGTPHSTIGIWLDLPAKGKSNAYYWMAAGTTYPEVAKLNLEVHHQTPEALIQRSSKYWKTWVHTGPLAPQDLPQSLHDVFNRSLLILRTQIDNRGAIIAANDSDIIRFGKDTYSYMWGRDGAFVAAALAKAGYSHVCMKYFDFCARILSDEGYLFQHYNPDGSLASNWHSWLVNGKEVLPIQEDSTALTLWALWIHYETLKDLEYIRSLYGSLIKKAADFLVRYRDPQTSLPLPSYDLWEERYALHAYTAASVIAGLRAASNFAKLFEDMTLADQYTAVANEMTEGIHRHLYHEGLGRFARSGTQTQGGYKLDEVIDISLLSLVTLGVLDAKDPRMMATAKTVREQLWIKTAVEGCARYEGDRYQRAEDSPKDIPGNPWFIATLWLAEYFIDLSENQIELQTALPYLKWCGKNALPSGVLAEQVHPLNGSPLSVSPLTWSHSAFVWTVLKYAEKDKKFKNQ